MGKSGLGTTQQGALSPACQSLLHHLTRLSSEPRRAPPSPVGTADIWGMGKEGRLKPVHLREPVLPTPARPKRMLLRMSATGKEREGEGSR